MANILIACAVCPGGDAFWERWLEGPALECGNRPGHVLRLRTAEIAVAGSSPALPDRNTIVRILRARLPTGRIDLLQLAIAVPAADPDSAARLAPVLAAAEGICNVPARVSVLILAPDVALRSVEGSAALRALIDGASGGPADCRDICWIRAEIGSARPAAEAVAATCMRAALHPVWAEDTGSRQPLAILQGLDMPHRDSISCRLVFDRATWLRYATADVGRRLAGFVGEPVPADVQRGVPEFIRDLLQKMRAAASALKYPQTALPPRAQSTSDSSAPGVLSQAVRNLCDQARRSSAEISARAEEQAFGGAAAEIARFINEAAKPGADELRSLARAFHRCEFLLAEIALRQQGPDPVYQALRREWIVAFNNAHKALVPSLSLQPFDPEVPSAWNRRLAEWQIQKSAIAAMPEHLQGPVGCVVAWANRLLPDVLGGDAKPEAVWEDIIEPLVEAAAGRDKAIALLLAECAAERERIEKEHPTPRNAFAQFLFGRARDRNLRRALEACDAAYTARLEAAHGQVDALVKAASVFFGLASRQEVLSRIDALLRATITNEAAPVLSLFRRFVRRHEGFVHELDRVPERAESSPDMLGLLTKTELAALAADVDPEIDKWLYEAREQIPIKERTWLTVADGSLESIDAWAAARARSLAVDLPYLLAMRFPHLAGPRLARLAEMARALLLPTRNQNAARRRLCHEWHVPEHPQLGANPAFAANTVFDEIVSTASTRTAMLQLDDRDRLELHLHLLGFSPPDVQSWNLFSTVSSPGIPGET